MPTFYGPRKSNRGQWSQMDLDRAIKAVQVDKISIRRAARENNIPEKTLHRRLTTGKFTKGSLGKSSYLGTEAESKLVAHVQKLQSLGFSPTRQTLRHLAYSLSQLMGLKGPFNETKKIAGTYWCMLFMKRNPTLCVRKADSCISIARNQGLDKFAVNEFFKLLTRTFTHNELLNKPGNIFTMDEICLQLQGENIAVIACCNAEGNFVPPYCVVKGIDNESLKECMPPGSVVKVRSESVEFNTELFMDWFANHFVVWKPAGQCVLVLDDHPSHMNSLNMLEIAIRQNITLQCLPSLSSYYLQPLDKSFFKPLKTAYRNASEKSPKNEFDLRDLIVFLSNAWLSTANVENATTGFSYTGIWPLNPSAIPESAYLVGQSTSSIITETVVYETPTGSLEKELRQISSDDLIEEDTFNENNCVECLNTCEETEKLNWIQCVRCLRWLHNTCSIYSDKCALCGRILNKQKTKELIEGQSASFGVQLEASVLEAGNVDIKEEIIIEETNLEDAIRNFVPKVESSSDDDIKTEEVQEYLELESHTLQQPVPHASSDNNMGSIKTTSKFQKKKRKINEKENIAEEHHNFRNNVQLKIEHVNDHVDFGFHVANRLKNSNQSDHAITIAKQKIEEILIDLERGVFETSC